LEQKLGEEQWSCIDSWTAEWSRLPIPNGPLTVRIDGDSVCAQGKQGWVEVIAGKSLLTFTRGSAPLPKQMAACPPRIKRSPGVLLFPVVCGFLERVDLGRTFGYTRPTEPMNVR
jgi:hypothetical protein